MKEMCTQSQPSNALRKSQRQTGLEIINLPVLLKLMCIVRYSG